MRTNLATRPAGMPTTGMRAKLAVAAVSFTLYAAGQVMFGPGPFLY